jgi:PAS domain S-box-containing protein
MPSDPRQDAGEAAELETLRARLQDAEETLRAIRHGEADALLVTGSEGPQVYTLVTADQSYRTLVEQMRDAALILSGDGAILYCNARLGALLGYAAAAPAGRRFLDLVAPESRAAVGALLASGARGEAAEEARLTRCDGGAVPVQLSVGPIHTGGFSGLALTASDLTERKRRERAAERERLTDAVLEFAGTAILVCDAAGTIIRCNPAAVELCGGGLIGRAFEEVLPVGVLYAELRHLGAEEQREARLRAEAGTDTPAGGGSGGRRSPTPRPVRTGSWASVPGGSAMARHRTDGGW